MKWHFKYDDGVTVFEFDVAVFGVSEADLASIVEATTQATTGGDPNYTVTYPNAAVKAYFCFDKANVAKMIKDIPQFFYDECLFDFSTNEPIAPDQQLLRAQINESPRKKGWTDTDGVKRAPPPSDKGETIDVAGAQGLYDAFLGLQDYAEALRKDRRVRDANIVEYAIGQVKAGSWTISHAFAYLRENGLA